MRFEPTGMFFWYVIFFLVFYCTNFFLQNSRGLGLNDGIKAQDDPTPNFATSTASTTTVVPNDDKRARDADALYVFFFAILMFVYK